MNWFSSVINLRGDSPTPRPPPPFKSHSSTTCKPGSGGKLRKHGWSAYEITASDRLKPRLPAFIPSLREFSALLFSERQKKNRDADCYQWVSQEERQRRDLSCILYLWCFVLFVCFFCCPVWDLRHIREERSKGLLVLKNSSFAVVIEINPERQPEWKAKIEERRERTHSNISSSNCRGSLHPSIHPFLSPFLGSGQEVT